jgi:hypothetical protein
MAFTMAYPNFKKCLKMAFGPLGVNHGFMIVGYAWYAWLEQCSQTTSINLLLSSMFW